ncbi:hypothetical protein [Nonomuraea sp. C10]|uniref:hypothetical protein n=1 Tax=Nonomuraea sp. C10 TaxID=2600577 RepID=UPI0011CE8385|nr:hypothetical protein [Nonomuraea sp. C10]TXK43296.1 hypothetical protein FR742_30250 [Nonomuraea sp. C10]
MQELRDIQIERLYEQGMSQREIAELYGLTAPRVNQILQGVAAPRPRHRRPPIEHLQEAVAAFTSEYKDTIAMLAACGTSRAEVIARFQVILPDVDITIVGKGIGASNAVFAHWHARDAELFSARVTEAAVWYLLGRSLNLAGNSKVALEADDFEEAWEVAAALEEQGVPRPDVASVLCLIAAARAFRRDSPDVTITRKRYDKLRLQAINEWNLPAATRPVLWPPTGLTVINRLGEGYWTDALRNIGLNINSKGRSRGPLKYRDEDYESAISDYFDYSETHGHVPSIEGYQRWVDSEGRAGYDRPSWGAVRIRYKTWSNVRWAADRPPHGQRASKVNRIPHSTRALHDAQSEWKRFVEELAAIPQTKASAFVKNFLRSYTEEFEFRRRAWLRAVVAADSTAATRLLEGNSLSKKQHLALIEGSPAEVLTDRYIDGLGGGDPRINDGWVSPDAQAELDAVPDRVALQYKVLRETRNYFTHTSNESRQRLQAAIDALAALDSRFTMNQALTIRILSDWLRAKDLQRLRILCSSVQELWRAMVVGETLMNIR